MTPHIHSARVNKVFLFVNIIIALLYFSWWLNPQNRGDPLLFNLLLFGEIYHLVLALTFWHTLWPSVKAQGNGARSNEFLNSNYTPSVDVYITVCGEPYEVVKKTVNATLGMTYPAMSVYILNDGFVAGSDNWRQMEILAQEKGVTCITRTIPGGAKAGNINNALRETNGEIIVIFDADMCPHPDFLAKVIPYFNDPHAAFVQTPQYYKNNDLNEITSGAWDQQEFFFGPIMEGKNRRGAAFICGTNVAIRKTAVLSVGGICEDNIAEDFLTSLFIHQKGWKSYYISEVLAEGLAPEDLGSYYKQQFRWARGSLEILFKHNPFFKRGLTFGQRVEYLASSLFYLNGLIVLIDMIVPVAALFTGVRAVSATTTSFAIFFIPYMYFSLYTLYIASSGQITFRALSYSQSSFVLQLKALFSILFRLKTKFEVTPKEKQTGNFLHLVAVHLFYIALGVVATAVAIAREGANASVITNAMWVVFNIVMFIPFIQAAIPKKDFVLLERRKAISTHA